MKRLRPPFRADHVGSLLRPQRLKEYRAKRERSDIGVQQFKAVEDECIRAVIKKQEEVGLQSITDGEFRRSFWHYDYLGGIDGVEIFTPEKGLAFKGATLRPISLRLTGKVGGFSGHPMLEHFKFVRDNTRRTPKMTIPAPSALHFRGGRETVSEKIYPDMAEFYRDLGQAYRKAMKAFADAGCRYLRPRAAAISDWYSGNTRLR